MLIAIPVIENKGEDSIISEHFGHAPYFAFIKVNENKIEEIKIEKNPYEEHGPGMIPEYIHKNGAKVLIVRGIGARAISFFEQYGIKVIRGASGSIKEIVTSFISGHIKDMEYKVKEKFHEH
ncbi:dinitrogenase iron-molybdenum cofactor biosynthesis protein [Thermosipho affectus]|uniref:Dinitrogenase iron-molybdenum cofactor biosynthesis protein n=1 Tax=Thermosipho affectus TaxID=660294 RepID=A0ABX3IGR8_9BACT|nr:MULTISPECIES: NifB/NifX family molybdenum-iron cluster-binding protein [Thermosipho]ANQ53666.1 iron-molybdenum cofactor-binding protein [Thermosipho sp. 1070]APT72112.1 dinitrogenase iron-molybdenum cofactor biosynthesis protein [Thermosipho sp. 1063]ONN27018.1 dinitrogenase iron-molybdenum cofactor biosynthesis protein [Thermosipho affectus]OOC43357.1 dinitrogenase iron-molybdenum cofactor biosynthesis protein [Thermosipho sp. 1074]